MKEIENKNGVIFHITHNDADALGCALVVDYIYRYISSKVSNHIYQSSLITKFCSATGADDAIAQILDEIDNGRYEVFNKRFIISDISISEETACRLEELDCQIELYDHHSTNNLNEHHTWATVIPVNPETGKLWSAAELMFRSYLPYITAIDKYPFFNKVFNKGSELRSAIEDISRYDTWLWKNEPKNLDEDKYDIIIKYYGIEKAFQKLSDNLNIYDRVLVEPEFDIIDNFREQKNNAIEFILEYDDNVFGDEVLRTPKNFVFTEWNNYIVGLLIPDPRFGNAQMEAIYNNYNVDIVVGLYPTTKTLSFRTRKDSINVGSIAKELGGGGHPKAAGAKVSTDIFLKWLKDYYDRMEA